MIGSIRFSKSAEAHARRAIVRGPLFTGVADLPAAGKRAVILFGALLVALALACRSDESAPANVVGVWIASVDSLSSVFEQDTVICRGTSPTTLTFAQIGSSVTGAFSGGEIVCNRTGVTLRLAFGTGTIANGTVNGQSIAFDLSASPGTSFLHMSGTVAGNTMSGTASMGDTVPERALTGTWTAEKQP